MNSLLISDAYKQSHKAQYPLGTNLVYSNWTPRSDKHANTKSGVVVFGIEAFFKKLNKWFDDGFFSLSESEVVDSFTEGYFDYFGEKPDVTHVEELHRLGYLPIIAKALPEGSICPIGVPMLTMWNTKKEFYWVTNFLETIMSTELWMPMTSATIAREYRSILDKWAANTCDNNEHVKFQAHDFSMRGMAGLESAMASGAGHLLSFVGSDTIPSVFYLKEYYNAKPGEDMVAVSIPATEHSVMSMGTKDDEIGTFKRLVSETYPNGIVSIVSDTWDLWKVCAEYIPKLKTEILARDGKIVIRPDSGDPADIICGKPLIKGKSSKDGNGFTWKHNPNVNEAKGVIELLWDTFGGHINNKGYKVLDSHIGAIYGDSITLERATDICSRLELKGFASSNIVFGVGSFTYQFNTRDTYGFAMKATYGEVNGIGREIFKDPITDDGTKKSLKGLVSIQNIDGVLTAIDQCGWEEECKGELEEIYNNGVILRNTNLSEIRKRVQS